MTPSASGGSVPRLHVVTDDDVLARPDFLLHARGLMGQGGAGMALHLRGPGTAGGRLYTLAASLGDVATKTGAWLVVNDRLDVALAVRARGVHLGRRSLPAAEARRLLGPDAALGVSVHGAGEAAEVGGTRVDWLFAGNVFPTGSHPGRGGGGTGLVGAVRATLPAVPVLAIGGVTPRRVAEVLDAGAWGVAVIGGIWGAPDPLRALDEYQRALAAPGGLSEEQR